MARLLTIALLSSMLGACGGAADSYQNSLTFGTGVGGTGFTLIGEAKNFSLSALRGGMLWFRLESREDIAGRFVRLYFNDITNKDFTPPQSSGHIMVANFPVSNAGTFNVKAFYVKTVVDIGKETLIASSPLAMTP